MAPTLRSAPLPYDTAYFLDCAAEYLDISAACYSALTLYGDTAVIDRIINEDKPLPTTIAERVEAAKNGKNVMNWRWDTRRRCIDLERYAVALREELDKATQVALVFLGFRSILRSVEGTAEAIAHWTFEDSTLGGCMKPFKDREVLDFRTMNPPPRLLRRLESPAFIRGVVKVDATDDLPHARRILKIVLPSESIGHVDFGMVTTASARINEIFEMQSRAFRERRTELTRRLADENDAIWNSLGQEDRVRLKLKKGPQKERRRALKRAVRTAMAVMGPERVAAFVRGEDVVLRGRELDFVLSRGGSLHMKGHGGLNVKLQSHDGGPLGRLCFYFENTPAIDQLVAIQMYLSTDDDDEILNTGNLFSLEPGAENHPAIAKRRKEKNAGWLDEAIPLIEFPPDRHRRERARVKRGFDRAIFRRRTEEYLAKTLPIYKEAAITYVFGASGKARKMVNLMRAIHG